jgi:hypothetical protein
MEDGGINGPLGSSGGGGGAGAAGNTPGNQGGFQVQEEQVVKQYFRITSNLCWRWRRWRIWNRIRRKWRTRWRRRWWNWKWWNCRNRWKSRRRKRMQLQQEQLNTGGGGGGGGVIPAGYNGGSGGSGIVIIRAPGSAQISASPGTNTVTTLPAPAGGCKVATFTVSGTLTTG